MKSARLRVFLCFLAGILLLTFAGGPAAAEAAGVPEKAARTILLYGCGSNLETFNGFLTWNLKQILGGGHRAGDQLPRADRRRV